jgi:hypothetical protein
MAPEANILLVETPMTETEGVYGFPQIQASSATAGARLTSR